MTQTLRILFVEDSEDDYLLVLRELRRNNIEAISERIETADGMRHALTNNQWDVVISDYSMPMFSAPQALGVLQASNIDLPFIIVSGTIGEETAVAALKAGAHDFLVKGNLARLVPAIQREIRDAKTRHAHRQATAVLREKEHLLSEAQRIGHVGSWDYDIVSGKLQFSDEMYRLFDIAPEDFVHNLDGLLNISYSSDRPQLATWMNQIRSGERPKELDFRIFRKSGELRYIQGRGAPVYGDSSEKPLGILGTMQDVTEHKLTEIQIRQQIARLTALRKIDRAIMSSFELRIVLDVVLSETLEQLQVDAASIWLLQPDGGLKYVTGIGLKTNQIETIPTPIGKNLAERAVAERRLIQVTDLNTHSLDQDYFRLLIDEGFVCYFGIPLITKEKVNGILEIFHRTPLQSYPEWLEFLETLAGQAAIAIDNATLFRNLQHSNFELKLAYDATIEGWSHALDMRDKETEGHTQRVTAMSIKLARIMGVPEEQLVEMHRGALLHDIGKMGIPDNILLKPDKLTDDEWTIMRLHPQLAYDWLKPITYLQQAIQVPYCHHEKWDGTGYPRGLRGDDIPFLARIFTIVDVWDALTSDRPYRPSWSKERTIEYISEQRGRHFDPKVVDVFLGNIDLVLE